MPTPPKRTMPGISLRQEMVPELNLEQQILLQLEKLTQNQDELKGQVRDLQTGLMGRGDGQETPYGRIPMMQSEVRRLSEKVATLEATDVTAKAAYAAYWNSARIVGHVLTAVGGGLFVMIGQVAMHVLFSGK